MRALIAGLCLFLVSCACWQPSHQDYNSTKCVVSRQMVDCTTGALQGLMPAALAIISPLLSGSTAIDWNFILDRLKGAGFENGLCILSQLQADFSLKPKGPQSGGQALALKDLVDRLKKDRGLSGVPVKVMVDGKAVVMR